MFKFIVSALLFCHFVVWTLYLCFWNYNCSWFLPALPLSPTPSHMCWSAAQPLSPHQWSPHRWSPQHHCWHRVWSLRQSCMVHRGQMDWLMAHIPLVLFHIPAHGRLQLLPLGQLHSPLHGRIHSPPHGRNQLSVAFGKCTKMPKLTANSKIEKKNQIINLSNSQSGCVHLCWKKQYFLHVK